MRPELHTIDYAVIGLYVLFALGLGAFFARKANQGTESFFVGDRKLTWWMAGTSIVATTFAADTPLAVTGIVAADGISGNWIWWSWAIAHVSATFFFARLWRRSGVITDAEITELRYSGPAAAKLRAFKALYFGLFINCLTMAWVISAMVKISRAFFSVDPVVVIIICVAISVFYTALGGFRSVVITDLSQFALGMLGALVLAWLCIDHFDGIGTIPSAEAPAGAGLLGALAAQISSDESKTLADLLDFVPRADHPTLPIFYFIVLLVAGWWRYAEGNGYLVQRLAACKDEAHAQGASLWFAVAHNALRPWPWILVALAALVVFPQLPGQAANELAVVDARGDAVAIMQPGALDVSQGGHIQIELPLAGCQARLADQVAPFTSTGTSAFAATFSPFPNSGVFPLQINCAGAPAPTYRVENVRVELLDREMAYPLMMGRFLPAGLLGLVIASLLAAFMSTIDTHTNWGASYLVRDVYQRFFRPDADDAHYVRISRLAILVMAVLAGISALFITNIATIWRFLVALGAGLGSVTAARWYWWRVTPQAEFAAIFVTTILAIGLELVGAKTIFGMENPLFWTSIAAPVKIILIAGTSLATWIPVALFGPQNAPETLRRFAERVHPAGNGWGAPTPARKGVGSDNLQGFCVGIFVVFGTLYGLGEILLKSATIGWLTVGAALLLLRYWIRRAPHPQKRELRDVDTPSP